MGVQIRFVITGSWVADLNATKDRVSRACGSPPVISLHVLAYNLKRMMPTLGAQPLVAALRA